jgi:hypothetical protein
MLSRRQLQGFVNTAPHCSGFSLCSPERESAALFKSFKSKSTKPARRRAAYQTLKSRVAPTGFQIKGRGITLAFSCGARSASKVSVESYLRNTLSHRQLQGFVRAPRDCNPHPAFLWQKRASAAKGIQRRSNVPSPVRYSYRRAVVRWRQAPRSFVVL